MALTVKGRDSSGSGGSGDRSKAVKNEKQPLISNWDDWFKSCGLIVGDVQDYETTMGTFYDTQYDVTPQAKEEAVSAYQAHHDCGFYNEMPLIPGWKIKKGVIAMFAGWIIGIIVAMIILYVTKSYDAGANVPTVLGSLAKRGVWWGLIGFVMFGGIVFLFHIMKINGLKKKLKSIEDKIGDRIQYIPPRYRNSQSIQAFYDLYCNYNIVTLSQAIPACDNYLQSNNLVGLYLAVMFNLPYENAGVQSDFSSNSNSSDKNPHLDSGEPLDPNCPSDIRSKVFEGVDDADARLNELVGLENVKQQIQQMKNRISFYGGSNQDRISGNHMVFLGPPGTGKTTIARIITKILYDFGYIRENRCVEIDGSYMKSPYANQTAERAHAIIEFARGGILFIDEAYTLFDDKMGTAGAEAVGVLLKAMEDDKDDLVVIMAGYEDNMNRLLSSNEGFSSRIKYKIYFDNFSVEEMVAIFKQLMRNSSGHRYKIDKSAMEILTKHFERERKVPGFGNARVIRNTWDGLLDIHADRFMKGEIDEDHKYVIMKADVEKYVEARREQMQIDGRNFIASRNLDSTIVSLQELKGKTKPGSSDPDADLDSLTGLEVVKNEIRQMKAQFEFYNGNIDSEGYHMVFLGPPGTGKTTVAAIMTGFLYKMGIIQSNTYVDINGDFLRGSYLGHTGKRTEAVVQYSQGMVLFVDEAYLLSSQDGGSDQFGQEAIGVLLDAMEKYRKNFVVIFAGYESEMQKFLDMNSGLRSRISLEFHFESYKPKELAEMFRNVAKKKGFKVDKEVWLPLQAYFKEQRQNPKFGNGRFVRQFFEEAKKVHIVNYSKNLYDESLKYTIMLSDIEELIRADENFVKVHIDD